MECIFFQELTKYTSSHNVYSPQHDSELANYKLEGSRAAMAISSADFPPNPKSLNSSYQDRGSNALRQPSRARLLDGPENGREFSELLAGPTGPDQLLPSLMLLWKRGHLARDQRHFGISHLCKCWAFTRHQARVMRQDATTQTAFQPRYYFTHHYSTTIS